MSTEQKTEITQPETDQATSAQTETKLAETAVGWEQLDMFETPETVVAKTEEPAKTVVTGVLEPVDEAQAEQPETTGTV